MHEVQTGSEVHQTPENAGDNRKRRYAAGGLIGAVAGGTGGAAGVDKSRTAFRRTDVERPGWRRRRRRGRRRGSSVRMSI